MESSPSFPTKVRELHLWQLFSGDPKRGERMTAEAQGPTPRKRARREWRSLTARLGIEAGVTILVAESAIFAEGEGVTAAMNRLRTRIA
jgi:hypothetical protein